MTVLAQPIHSPSQLGLLLKSARKSHKLSQAQLASRIGLSQSRLSELEGDAGTLSVEQLLSLCQQLGLQLTLRGRDADPRPVATAKPTEW